MTSRSASRAVADAAGGEGPASGRTIGRGRSAIVRLVEGPEGPVAEKVFVGDVISNLVHRIIGGAPLPYRWSEDAVRAAVERRRVLAILLPFWFGDRLRIARPLGHRWDPEARAFVLIAEHAPGGPVRLRHPLRPQAEAEERLRLEVMPALQAALVESGFDGLVWQAGLGNPKAYENFLFDPATGAFTLVDGESGVPAIFATSLRAWLDFYGPATRRYGRPLMDDVDCGRLRRWIADREASLIALHGADGVATLRACVDRLEKHQRAWLDLTRRGRARAAAERLGRRREGGALDTARRLLVRGTRLAAGLARRLEPARNLRAARDFATSQSYRTEIGARYVRGRIAHWRARGQLSVQEAAHLDACLTEEREAGRYLTDFGAHLGMKASFLAFEILALGVLTLIGIPIYVLGLIIVLDGPIYRTVYSLGRSLQNLAAGRPILWTALAVGLAPFFGSLAFPAQMLWSAAGRRDVVARFVVYDSFARLAAAVPLVGGEDTSLEHRLNRLAQRLVGDGAEGSKPQRSRAARRSRTGPARQAPGK